MTVIARDAVAADHLVYAWPFPIGPECEVKCADDDSVVMCPAWLVGDRLGPGRHVWRTPDPTRPVSAYFVLSQPVEVSFDLSTLFHMPSTNQPIRLRAVGSLQVRCVDPALLVAQFVGLPFDGVNDGLLRSVSRSVERMLARLLTRRVVITGSAASVTDPGMLPHLVDELVAYNPAAGAVFGIELIRMGHLAISGDDGTQPQSHRPMTQTAEWGRVGRNGELPHSPAPVPAPKPADAVLDTARGMPRAPSPAPTIPLPAQADPSRPPPLPPLPSQSQTMRHAAVPAPKGMTPGHGVPLVVEASASNKHQQLVSASGEIVVKPPPDAQLASGTPIPRAAQSIEVPRSTDDITQPSLLPAAPKRPPTAPTTRAKTGDDDEPRGSILGIGVSHIGSATATSVAGEIPSKVAPGARVLVPGPNGLMQSATVRQLLQGYYELEVGSSGETIWVPIHNVVPE